jgi:hypothetical protein
MPTNEDLNGWTQKLKPLDQAVALMTSLAADDGREPSGKRAQRDQLVAEARRDADQLRSLAEQTARGAMERAEAARRADPVGSAAEESRRVADELKINRLVSTAQARGPEGASKAARDLAQRASAAFEAAEFDEAKVLATAAESLGNGQASVIVAQAQTAIDMTCYPARRAAIEERNSWDIARAAFHRDVSARLKEVEKQAAAVSRIVGDDQGAVIHTTRATSANVAAKMQAAIHARQAGVAYAKPAGADD